MTILFAFKAEPEPFSSPAQAVQSTISAGQIQPITCFLKNKEQEPADALLEADGLRSFRACVQERNTYPVVSSTFTATTFSTHTDNLPYSKKSIDLITGYLACIYPSHNFW